MHYFRLSKLNLYRVCFPEEGFVIKDDKEQFMAGIVKELHKCVIQDICESLLKITLIQDNCPRKANLPAEVDTIFAKIHFKCKKNVFQACGRVIFDQSKRLDKRFSDLI